MAVDAVAAVFWLLGIAFQLVRSIAGAAGRPQPGVADLVTDLQVVDALTERDDVL